MKILRLKKTIKMSLAGKVMLNKLRPLRKGWISSEGINKKSKNPYKNRVKTIYIRNKFY